MSYYRRRYRRRPRWDYRPLTQSEQLQSEARKKATDFVISKFRSLTPTEFQSFGSWYYSKHGRSAYDYFLKTYWSWKQGVVGMSGQTSARILAGVPRVMSRSEQFQLLRFYLPYFLSKPRDKCKRDTVDSTQLSEFYVNAGQTILGMAFDLDWFVSAVFSEQEISTFQTIIRYILLRRLETSFSDVRKDLIDLHNTLRTVEADVSVSYRVNFLDTELSVSDVHAVAKQSLVLTLPPLSPEDANQTELRSILADYTLTDRLKYHFASGVHAIAINDIQQVIAQMKVTRKTEEWESDTTVECRGGIAQIRVVKISVPKQKLHIATCYCKMGLLILAFLFAVRWASTHRGAGGIVVFGGFLGLGWLIALWQSAHESRIAIKTYEQRRSKVFATN